MIGMGVGSLVIEVGQVFNGQQVHAFVEARPALVAGLERTGARVVVFQVMSLPLFPAVQAALDKASRAVPADVWPLFVVEVLGVDWMNTVKAEGRSREDAWRSPRMVCPRGVFVGYVVLGNGGYNFVQPGGTRGLPPDSAFLARLPEFLPDDAVEPLPDEA